MICIEKTVKYNTEFIKDILQVNEETDKGYLVKVNDTNNVWKIFYRLFLY
ncbi:MAG: hypothetical protein LBI73_07940 [Myroides sp.]|jgi:hypothetical protein|nr:hypothetical protein [Myroides sp.]